MNSSLEFLQMIKNQSDSQRKATVKNSKTIIEEKPNKASGLIAVIDTETNWHDQVMSLGVALADESSFKLIDQRYYIFEPECRIGGIYSSVIHHGLAKEISSDRKTALADLKRFLTDNGIEKIFAYNAKFDYNHLPELQEFMWYDIMRIAAYKQYNSAIPDSLPCCKTGRLKTNYGVEPITCLLTGDNRYREIHNAVYDAIDELRIMELLGHPLEIYECAKL